MKTPFNYLDFGEFLDLNYYRHFSGKKIPYTFIKHQLQVIESYSKFIPQYPNVKCEYLDFFYLCFKSVCALDEKLFVDFTNFSWRGIVWVSWIAAITPYQEPYMIKHLEKVKNNFPCKNEITQVALNVLSKQRINEQLYCHLNRYRELIKLIPKQEIPLRLWYPNVFLRRREIFRKNLKMVYNTYGTKAAITFFHEHKSNIYDLEYIEWLKIVKNKV